MTQTTLLAAALAAGTAGLAYAYLGERLRRDALRHRGKEGPALRSFALWWGTLAINMLLVAATYVLAAYEALAFPVQLGVSVTQRVLLGLGVAGLLRYLIYLRTGRDLIAPLAVVYAAFIGVSLASMVYAGPSGVFVGEWRTELTYALRAPAWGPAANLLVVLPSIIASVAYFLLYFGADEAHRRYRIATVSWALVGWWTVAIVAGQSALLDVAWLQILNRAASVMTALLVLSAHHPPAWLERRLERADRRARDRSMTP